MARSRMVCVLALVETSTTSLSEIRLVMFWSSAEDQFVFQAGLANSAGSTVCRKVVMSAWVMFATAGAFWAKPK